MAGIGENRVFDRAALEELKEQAKAMLACAAEVNGELREEMTALLSTMREVPGEAYHGGVESAAGRLLGMLDETSYENLKGKIQESLDKLTALIPLYDSQSAAVLTELSAAAKELVNRTEELKSMIRQGSLSLSMEEFTEKLEMLGEKWQKESLSLEGTMLLAMTCLKGMVVTSAYSKDPVNLSTGNFYYEKEDLKIRGGIPLCFKRYYNALDKGGSALGAGWSHTHGEWLEKAGEDLIFHQADGKETTFRKEGTDYRDIHKGTEKLRRENGGFAYEEKTGQLLLFGEDGSLHCRRDKNGNEIRYERDDKGRLLAAGQQPGGGSLFFDYGEDGFLRAVRDHTGRTVSFFYLEGRLSEVTDAEGSTASYRYEENGRMRAVKNAAGTFTVRNTYDENGRVLTQRFPDKGEMQYAYEEGNRTVLTERNGSRMTYVQDEKLRHVKTIYHDSEETFSYDEKDHLTGKTDRNGNRTVFSYDENGNMTAVINALGERLDFSHNAEGKLLCIRDGEQVLLENSYDKKGHLLSTKDAMERSRTFTYDTAGRIRTVTEADGGETTLTYDERGNIRSICDAAGTLTVYEYDGLNRVTATTDGNGNETHYAYDKKDRLVRVVNPEGNTRRYTYNGSGKVTAVEDFDGGVSTVTYNCLNRPEVLRDKEGRETKRFYDKMWNVAEEISPTGAVTRYTYDEDNRLSGLELCSGEGKAPTTVMTYTHDKNGNLTCAKAGDGSLKEGGEALSVLSYTYDALNRVTAKTDGAGNVTRYEYDRGGNLVCITDALGGKRLFTYNAAGECLTEMDETGNETAYTYDDAGRCVCIRDAAGRETHYEYAPGGRLEKILYPDGTFLSYAYDGNGNPVRKEDGRGNVLHYSYDCMNRLVCAEDGKERKTTYAYDASGNVTAVTDTLGNKTCYEYTPSGKLSAVTDALGNRTEYRYDALDNLIFQCRKGKDGEADRMTGYRRNPFGQAVTITDALGMEEHYTYDALGRVRTKTDREGFVTTKQYQAAGEVSHILYGDGKSVELEYDALNRLHRVKDGLGITTITRDAAGNPVKITDHNGKETGYEWGKSGERRKLLYPNGSMVQFSYDSLLRLTETAVTGTDGKEQNIRYLYDEAGRLAEKQFPQGLKTTWLYDGEGQLKELLHEDKEGILDRYRYEYDKMGNKTAVTRERRGAEAENGCYRYAYDALGRLTETEKDGMLLRSYRYDSFGNRLCMEEPGRGRRKDYTYDALNRLCFLEEQGREGSRLTGYGYDRRGNLTEEKQDGILVHRYAYGADNRLALAENGTGERSVYSYNGLGMRTGRSRNGREETYLLDLTKPYHNLLALSREGKEQVFYQDGNTAAMEEEGSLHYYMQDELGSPLRVSGYTVPESGNGYLTYGYDEFGNDLYREAEEEGIQNPYKEAGEEQPFGYTGYRYDRISGTYFAQAREYRAGLGRFCAEDVLAGNGAAPETLNRYGYCLNSPLRYVDLDGLAPETDKIVQNEWVDGAETDYMGVYYLNAEDGAFGFGHSALMFVRDDGSGTFYSFAASSSKAPSIVSGMYVQGYLSKAELTPKDVYRFFGGEIDDAEVAPTTGQVWTVGIDGRFLDGARDLTDPTDDTPYTRAIYIPITAEEGKKMTDYANQMLGKEAGKYNLYARNCGMVAQEILSVGEKDFAAGPKRGKNWDEGLAVLGIVLSRNPMFGFLGSNGITAGILKAQLDKDFEDQTIPNGAYSLGLSKITNEVLGYEEWEAGPLEQFADRYADCGLE